MSLAERRGRHHVHALVGRGLELADQGVGRPGVGQQVDRRLDPAAQRDPVTRAYVDAARERPLAVPGAAASVATRTAVRAANVAAFHRGMVVSGLLMLAGGLIAGVGIANPPRPEVVAQPPAVAA
jgi:hypothetical protein